MSKQAKLLERATYLAHQSLDAAVGHLGVEVLALKNA
jgi:hypothetical protein